MSTLPRLKALRAIDEGACVSCNGRHGPRLPGRQRCQVCLTRQAAAQRRQYERYKKAGLCTKCHGELNGDGCVTCAQCREMARQYQAQYYSQRAKQRQAEIQQQCDAYVARHRALRVAEGRRWTMADRQRAVVAFLAETPEALDVHVIIAQNPKAVATVRRREECEKWYRAGQRSAVSEVAGALLKILEQTREFAEIENPNSRRASGNLATGGEKTMTFNKERSRGETFSGS